MMLGYEQAMEWLEEVGSSGMRVSDVINIIRVHMDHVKAIGMDQESRDEDEWTEGDDEFVDTILKEMEAKAATDESDKGEDNSESIGRDDG
jgi:hypothetical protein